MSNDTQGQTKPQPTPAAGQIWHDGSEEVIVRIVLDRRETRAVMRSGHSYGVDGLRRVAKCIGVETAFGRVMIGERRHNGSEVRTVSRIFNGNWVSMPLNGNDDDPLVWPAEMVATWPLVYVPARCKCGAPTPIGCFMIEFYDCIGCSVSGLRITGTFDENSCAAFDIGGRRNGLEYLNIPMRRMAASDPREQGPGIARMPPPAVRPDVVFTWEEWALP
jgi:hypothetical protein